MKINNNQNFKSLPKKEKVKILLDYARELYKRGYKPTKRGIRKEFNVEVYNYFKNIGDYHKKAGIEVSLRHHPKEKARSIIINYVKKKSRNKCFPFRKELEKKFKIHFSCYFNDLKDLYIQAGIKYSFAERAIKKRIDEVRYHDEATIRQQKKEIQNLIRGEVRGGSYPSTVYIQKKLNLAFYNLYKNIRQAYAAAGVEYERPSPILLGTKKEKVFTKIIKELLGRMGFQIIRVSVESKEYYNKKADMVIKDTKKRIYLVELKAYRKDYSITKREFDQLRNYLKKENISCGFLITTSDTQKCPFSNVEYINGKKVIELLTKYGLSNHIRDIKWIQESRVNSKERTQYVNDMKDKIFKYIQQRQRFPTKTEIEKYFRVDIRSFFGEPKPYEKLQKEFESRYLPTKNPYTEVGSCQECL